MESSSSFSSSSFLGSSKRAKAPASNVGQVVAHCLVDGCDADLSLCKDYHRRHKVCEAHSKTPRVTISGREQRFCQQCSRFHSLVEFDEGKRSCRKRLDGHNRRRRKPQPECMSRNVFSNLQQHGGSDHHLLCFSSPQIPPPSSVLTPSWAAAAPAPAPAENDHMLYSSSSTHQLNYMNPQSSSDPNASHCALSLLSPAPQFGLSHHPHNLHYSYVHDSSAPLNISAPMFHQTTAAEGGSSPAPQSHQTCLTFTWETASLKWEQLKMEVVSEKRGSMKSKLMMSFYRGGGKQAAAVTTVKPSPAALLVVKKTTTFRSDDGYFHGPNGGGGDQLVDNKATSYISQFKQRLRLEESDLMIDDP